MSLPCPPSSICTLCLACCTASTASDTWAMHNSQGAAGGKPMPSVSSPCFYPCHSLCLEWHPLHQYREIFWTQSSMTVAVLFWLCPQGPTLYLASKQVSRNICWVSEGAREKEGILEEPIPSLGATPGSLGIGPQSFPCASTSNTPLLSPYHPTWHRGPASLLGDSLCHISVSATHTNHPIYNH